MTLKIDMETAKPELLQLFPTPVLIVKYEDNFEDELKFIKNLDYDRKNTNDDNELLNRQSTNTFLLEQKELSKIKTFIEECLRFYSEKVFEYSQEFVITQSWANKNEKGQSHHEHVHPNSIISGVFYFQIDERLPPIEFKKDNQNQFSLNIRNFNNFNSHKFLLPLNSGELILFPSTLTHSVPANKSDQERISLSFNTFAKNNIGMIDNLTYLPIDKCI